MRGDAARHPLRSLAALIACAASPPHISCAVRCIDPGARILLAKAFPAELPRAQAKTLEGATGEEHPLVAIVLSQPAGFVTAYGNRDD
jgi:hypothetical protein